MNKAEIEERYFDWMVDLVCGERYADDISYRELLSYLHSVEFIYIIPKDGNRASDGISLRRRFAYEFYDIPNADKYIEGPCSVLEMMIALSFRCEEIMDDPQIGNRTSQWFWRMLANLGLYGMTDDAFDERVAEDIVETFLERKYEPDGRGGLFRVFNSPKDMRSVEIWVQMCWFIDTIV